MREAEKRNAERCNDYLAPLDLQPCSGTSLEAALMAAVVCKWKGKPVACIVWPATSPDGNGLRKISGHGQADRPILVRAGRRPASFVGIRLRFMNRKFLERIEDVILTIVLIIGILLMAIYWR